MKILPNLFFSILFVSSFISCSSDSDSSDEPVEITVSTSDFTTTIDESPVVGQVIGTVSGTTNQGSLTFSIVEQNPSGAFTIDSDTGELTVANEALFDYETNPTITGIVKVANGNVFENSNVLINVNEVIQENIYYGDVVLLTQEEVNEFGANNYTEITGILEIGRVETPNNSISDLGPLESLVRIGALDILFNNSLITLDGLENVESIGGNLFVRNNENLLSIETLSNINNVGLNINISENNSLIDLIGLNGLTEISGYLTIKDNSSLIDVDALNNLTFIEWGFTIGGSDIANLDGLSNLSSLGEDASFAISENPSLTNLEGLLGLASAPGGILINRCPLLSNLNGISNINTTSLIQINDCDSLINLEGLHNITNSFDEQLYIKIMDNNLLVNLNGLENLPSNLSNIEIVNNPSLINIDGLLNINTIAYLLIFQNNSLVTLNGLNSLTNINNLTISFNNTLSDFCGLEPMIVGGGLGGDFHVIENAYNPTQQDIIDGNCSL